MAHKFFIFFFVPYQNNLGNYFDKQNLLKQSDLMNIENISVMISIFNNYPEFKKQFNLDCEKFFNSITKYN